ncbi:MAG: hypothetical protein ACRDJM_03000 [Actinomycetota bacterium]
MQKLRYRVLALAAVAALLPVSPAAAATPVSLIQSVQEEADYILSMRLGDGAIPINDERDKVIPYLANFAAIGLARAYTLLRDTRYSSAAWRWLEWYRQHQDPVQGTIPNWIFQGRWIPEGLPDSTDAYAGTFMSAVLATYTATGDLARLQGLAGAVELAIVALELTEDDDGLHFARPGWPFKYSMDEAEAYAGLLAGETIGEILRDGDLARRAGGAADRLFAAHTKLKDPATGLYLWAIHDDGTRVTAPLAWIYPGASAQVWAVADGFETGPAAAQLMQRVEAAQPVWDRPTFTTQWYDGHPSCGGQVPCMLPVRYWPRFAMAYLAIGDARRALKGATNIQSAARLAQRRYPYTPGEAGQLIMVFGDPDVMASSVSPVALPPLPA